MAWLFADDQITHITNDHFLTTKAVNQWYNESPFLNMLSRKKQRFTGGPKVRVGLVTGKNTSSGWYHGFGEFDVSPVDQLSSCQVPVHDMYMSVTISGDDMDANREPEKAYDLLGEMVENAKKSLQDNLSIGLLSNSDDTGDPIIGIQHILSADRTVAGIDSTAELWWEPPAASLDAATALAALTFETLGTVYGSCTRGTIMPDLIVCTQAVWNRLASLAQPAQIFTTQRAGVDFVAIKFRKAEIIADPGVTAGHMYLLNTQYWKMLVREGRDVEFLGWERPIKQDCRVGIFLWKGSQVCTQPRYQGAMTALV